VLDIEIQALRNKQKTVSSRFGDVDVIDAPETFSLKDRLNAEFESKRTSEERKIIIKISNRYLEK